MLRLQKHQKKGLPLELVLDMDKMIELLLKHMALSFALKSCISKLLEFVLCQTKSLNLHPKKKGFSKCQNSHKEFVGENGKGKESGSVELVSLHLIPAIGTIII